jgi:hypothetical protein
MLIVARGIEHCPVLNRGRKSRYTHSGCYHGLKVNQSPPLDRAARRLLTQAEEAEGAFFTLWLPLGDRLAFWFSRAEINSVIHAAATKAVARLARQPIPPGRLLAASGVPAKVRSRAARSMLAMRGGKATAAKMSALGFPNLAKAREVLRRKADSRRSAQSGP